MRQRNHRCEWCRTIYVTWGDRRHLRLACSEACKEELDHERSNIWQTERYRSDPEFRQRMIAANSARAKHLWENDPEYRKARQDYLAEWRQERRDEDDRCE